MPPLATPPALPMPSTPLDTPPEPVLGAPGWKHVLTPLLSAELIALQQVIQLTVHEANERMHELSSLDRFVGERNGVKQELERFGMAVHYIQCELRRR